MQENLNQIIESLLFASEDPLTVENLKNILETVDPKEIRLALQDLAAQYDARGGGFKLTEVAGGWQLRSRPEYNLWIKRMLQPSPQRLSKAALETLAIVAYNQPIIRADIEHIRGVDSGGVLRQLLERKLLRVLGRKEIPGRPLIYATTKLFLELFELKDLRDLPSPKEIEEMSAAAGVDAEETSSEDDQASLFEAVHTVNTIKGSGTANSPKWEATGEQQKGNPDAPSNDARARFSKEKLAAPICTTNIASTRSKIPSGRTTIAGNKPRVSRYNTNKI